VPTRAELPTAAPFVPAKHTLSVLRPAVQGCRGCDLYKFATQAVFGEGPKKAALMLVGEQPGNDEDLAGAPFVGPAGRILDRALADARIPRDEVYVTNAVKHFKFVERGKRRLHKAPRMAEILACRPWLVAELDAVLPHVVVAMGATAAKSILGNKFALMKQRGTLVESPLARRTIATVHPSAVLRAIQSGGSHELYEMLVDDLKLARKAGRAA
jgi:uracil-DNA glycosylase family protein